MTQSQNCWLLNPSPRPASGVTVSAQVQKPIAVLLDPRFGMLSAATVIKSAISTPDKTKGNK
jgi:hypothetical protein